MTKIPVLDHGFVKLLNISSAIPRDDTSKFSARDIDPAICARISFDNFEEGRTEEQDLKLVEYLIANSHSTPLEMTTIWLEIKLPIFIARQFHRHRMQTINETSARYVTLPEEWYIPEIVGGKSTSGAKQGQEDNLDQVSQDWFRGNLGANCKRSYDDYLTALSYGVAPEHARLFLHVNHYTHYIFKMDLHNMFHFLRLRLHSHAQIEARLYAQAILKLLTAQLPETMKLFEKYGENNG
jgi:thymidylate synthase (FAD)